MPRRNFLLEGIDPHVRLEHLAISFAISAQDVFSTDPPFYGPSLKTVALTSDILTSHSSEEVNRLLRCTARGAKALLPQLELVEIWYHEAGEAGIFRYEKSDRSGEIVWLGTWNFEMSTKVEKAWQEVFDRSYDGMYKLVVKLHSLPKPMALGYIFPYLRLRKHILQDTSWAEV